MIDKPGLEIPGFFAMAPSRLIIWMYDGNKGAKSSLIGGPAGNLFSGWATVQDFKVCIQKGNAGVIILDKFPEGGLAVHELLLHSDFINT